jgi:hypothetical protein
MLHILLTSFQHPTKLHYEHCSQITAACALLNAVSLGSDCHTDCRIIAEVYIIRSKSMVIFLRIEDGDVWHQDRV